MPPRRSLSLVQKEDLLVQVNEGQFETDCPFLLIYEYMGPYFTFANLIPGLWFKYMMFI